MTKKLNTNAVLNNEEVKTEGELGMNKLTGKYLISKIIAQQSQHNPEYKEFVATVKTPLATTWGKEPGVRVSVDEIQFTCYPTYTKDGPVWRARVSDVTKHPNGRYEKDENGNFVYEEFVEDGVTKSRKKVERYGLACIAARMSKIEDTIMHLSLERAGLTAAIEFCPLTEEERVRIEAIDAEVKELKENADPCNGCGNKKGCKNFWKSFLCWPKVTLFDGASYREMVELATSVASVVARVVDPRYPKNIKTSAFAAWNKCSTCKFAEYITTDNDPDGIDPVTGTITMERGKEYRRQPGLCDEEIRNSRDPMAKRPNHFCVLHSKDVFDYDACPDYIYRTIPLLFSNFESDPVVRADNLITEDSGRLIGTKAYAQFCTDKLPELKVIEVGEEKEKEPGHIPTAYKAGTFVVVLDELAKKEPSLMRALGTVNVCEQRQRESDGKEFTYLNLMLLDDTYTSPVFKDVTNVRRVPEKLMTYVFANMEEAPMKAVKKLRELMPKEMPTEEEVETSRLQATLSLPTYVELALDSDFVEGELAVTTPGLYTTMTKSPWKVADVFLLSKSGRMIKGMVKRQRVAGETKYSFDLVAGYLTREEFALTAKAAILRVAENLKAQVSK